MNKLYKKIRTVYFSKARAKLFGAVTTLLLLSLGACEPNHVTDVEPNQTLQTSTTQTSYSDADSVDSPNVLAYQLPNPYTVSNMRQAYQNMYGGSWTHIGATHQYVRFKPTTKEQLLVLIETLDLDLFDEPLDYKISQEGDFYQDPSIPMEQITWQYTVVPSNFTFPAGIQYQVLAAIHIPSDANDVVEAEAERLVGLNADGDDFAYASIANNSSTDNLMCPTCDLPDCPPGTVWDEQQQTCADDTRCPPGFMWDDGLGSCVSINPPRETGGRLLVRDTQLGDQGVRNVRVVAKRWFKIERMYTNNNGFFNSTRKFRNSVKLVVKFKNDDASIRRLRGARLWQMLFPVQQRFGALRGSEINNFTHTFILNNDYASNQTLYWTAATTHNSVQQFKGFSAGQGTGGLPTISLKVLLNRAAGRGAASAPLFSARGINILQDNFVRTYIAFHAYVIEGGISALVAMLRREVDITYSYDYGLGELRSDVVAEVIYHELAHATLYRKAGDSWYDAVVNGTLAEIASSGPSPYGTGNTANSPIIALNEGWANHYGNFLANLRYANNTDCISVQRGGAEVCSNNLNSRPYLEALELFSPNIQIDPFRWIPKGLFLDMIDDSSNEINTAPTFINDQVLGYNNSQLFQAIESGTRSPQAYRDRLLQLNNNWQFTQVQTLFAQYNYQ